MGMPIRQLTLEEFIEWENVQPEKNEFVRGEVLAMAAEGRKHGCVISNLYRLLGDAVAGSGCQVFGGPMKMQIGTDTLLHADVFVTGDPEDLRTDEIFRAPVVVVEVLSPRSQDYDRGLKFALYRRLPSLREYVLIDPDTRRVEASRVGVDGLWVLHDMSDGDALAIPAIDASIPLSKVFAGVDAG